MRWILRIFAFTLTLLVVAAIAAVFVLQDANRLKPEIEALIQEQTDYTVKLNGDLNWQLFPPLNLTINDITAQGPDLDLHAASVALKMDLSAIWQDVNKWRISQLTLTDTLIMQEGASADIASFTLDDFAYDKAADFSLDISYMADQASPAISASLIGQVQVSPAESATQPWQLQLIDTQISNPQARGLCQLDATQNLTPGPTIAKKTDEDILPLHTLADYNLVADCKIAEVTIGSETFNNVELELTNVNGKLNVLLASKEFLGGQLMADVDVNLHARPISWTILPELKDVDSRRLIDWAQQDVEWIGIAQLNSTIQLRGNSRQALVNSISAKTDFDGGQGQINIAKIKQQLAQIALLTKQSDDVAKWPDMWDYKELTGRWQITGPVHDLSFAIDNMSVKVDGEYDYLADNMNLLGHVIVAQADEDSPFQVNSYLEDTPIPVLCTGPAADPDCRLDSRAAQKLIRRALTDDSDTGLRRKLEEKIEEEVPEEYRDAAKSLLDLLGRSLRD